MRSRPVLELLHSRLEPGKPFTVQLDLVSTSETPVEFVLISLVGTESLSVGAAEHRRTESKDHLDLRERHDPKVLPQGTRRLTSCFDIPAAIPRSYASTDAWIRYVITVHVSIPWWPDSLRTYDVPAQWPQSEPPVPLSTIYGSGSEGEKGTDLYMEVSMESTALRVGDVLRGQLAVSNYRGRKLRGIDVAFVQEEVNTSGLDREVARVAFSLHGGTPPEGEAVDFAVQVPSHLAPDHSGELFWVQSFVEVRAVAARGDDAVLRQRLHLHPAGPPGAPSTSPPVAGTGVAPVGRQRRANVWATAADAAGLDHDGETERTRGVEDRVKYTLCLEQRSDSVYQVAELAWPSLGLDVTIREKSWTAVLATSAVALEVAPARFVIHARDAAQAAGAIGASLFAALEPFDDITFDDDGARVSLRGAPSTVRELGATIALVQRLVTEVARMARAVPPPTGVSVSVPAWTALAERLAGELSIGRLAITTGRLGSVAVEIETLWSRQGDVIGTCLSVALEPPLDDVDERGPAFSAASRALLATLRASHPNLTLAVDGVTIELGGALGDPHDALPPLESLAHLAFALRGVGPAGPFR